jgi:NhaP-type Na+/H+ or K+/H+ antiporter
VHEVLTLLGISVAAVAVFSRFHLPPIVGYLFVGFITGPHALGLVRPGEVTHLLGEIGVAFLLFTIGLEFSLSQLKAMKTVLLGLGGTQVAVGTVSGALISWGLGIDWAGAFIVGGALSLSSTAIVIRQLADQLELQSRHGRLSLGVLLFQDLAAVPFLVVIPILASQTGQGIVWPLILALIKGAVAFLIMLMLGRWALRPLFHMWFVDFRWAWTSVRWYAASGLPAWGSERPWPSLLFRSFTGDGGTEISRSGWRCRFSVRAPSPPSSPWPCRGYSIVSISTRPSEAARWPPLSRTCFRS